MWVIGIAVCLYSFTVNGNEECIPGTFGDDCNQNCSQNCHIPPNTVLLCNKEDGTCYEGCNLGFYGDQCDQRCSKNCKEHVCLQINGQCSEGCIDNHIGDFCEIVQDPPPVLTGTTTDVPTTVTTTVIPPRRASSETVAIAVIIPVVVVVLVLVVTVCIILKRSRKREKHKMSENDAEVGQELLQGSNLTNSSRDDTALHDACRRGTLAEVRQMISEDQVNINSRGKCGWTPVMIAAEGGCQELVDLLVRRGCDLALKNDDGNTILHVASVEGHLKIVRSILSTKEVDVNTTGHCNRTAVMAAARFGHRKVFDVLVKNGSVLSPVDSDGNNILHIACIGGHVEIVKYILTNVSVDNNSRGYNGMTPVVLAANSGHMQVFELLARQGCLLPTVDRNGRSILHYACVGNNVAIVNDILKRKIVSTDSKDGDGKTPVMLAAECGHTYVFKLLVNHRCDTKVVCENGNNILHTACIGGHVEIVKYILTNVSLDINSRGHNGMTPVMLAANSGHMQVFELLVRQGCLLPTVDRNGRSILHYACVGNNVAIVNNILKKNIVSVDGEDSMGKTPVMLAVECGHTDVFQLLVRKQRDIHKACHGGNSILHTSCALGHVDIVKCILTEGRIHIDSCGQNQMTPVMLAAKNGQREIFDLLVNNGCDMKTFDTDGNTVLHMACIGGNKDIVEDVLSKELVDINSRGQSQRTPAMVAAACGHREVFDLLVNRGADLTLVDSRRFGIIQLIAMGGHLQMLEHVRNVMVCR